MMRWCGVAFLNVVDKGYRCTAKAFQTGRQLVPQPHFTNALRDFSTEEILGTSETVNNRLGNERGVDRVKTSSYIKRGIEKAEVLS